MSYSILDAIGNTPLAEIKRLNPNPKVRILAKLEYFNPGGSVKDRPALYMINAGERSGELTPDKTVIEATSGNTGIGLALVCAVKGYKLLLTMSEAVSEERRKILKARGAEILLTPGHLGTDGAIEEVYRLARENPDTYFLADQFNNEANWQAHYFGTGEEIWRQTGGEITRLVASMGTTGTLMGTQRRLKELAPEITIVGVEPYLGHKIQGLKNMKEAYRPEIFEKQRLDKIVNIDDEDAFEMTRRLAREEGLMVGMSSGAAMHVALNEARQMERGLLVVILPDSGERYLSTPLFAVKEKIGLQLFNTLGRAKAHFEPHIPGKVSLYSCGPTAHARMHPGDCRRMVFADLLARYLAFRGYAVTHVVHIADFDDKTIKGAENRGVDIKKFTDGHIQTMREDLARLGIRPHTTYCRTSEHMDDMNALAKSLAEKSFAYEKLRSLYFNLSKLPEYGRLSGIDIDKIRVGATVDLDEYEKDNPRDFTLFKRAKLSELKRGMYVKSQWGSVRPSWHLQCAAICRKFLGEHIDIHTSSRDHIFPHHENEIAISTALTGRPSARYWIHCDQVLIEADRGDVRQSGLTFKDLTEMGLGDREIRFWMLSTHYRKPITLSKDRLTSVQRSLGRLDACTRSLREVGQGKPYPEIDQLLYDIKQEFTSAMDDDLNISAALAAIFRKVKKINILVREKRIDAPGAAKIVEAFRKLDSVLNVFDFSPPAADAEVEQLLRQREQARRAGNWTLADQVRDRLRARGVTVRDLKVQP